MSFFGIGGGGSWGGAQKRAVESFTTPISAPTLADALAILQSSKPADTVFGGKKKKGRAATLLTGYEGAGLPQTATKTLLGGDT